MADAPIICVVDDEPAVREALCAVVESAGMVCETFESAEEYMTQGHAKACGCLLLDLRLRGMSGLQLLEKLRHGPGRTTTIVMTGHGDIPVAVECMKMGAVDFLEKPLDHKVLLAKLEAAIRNSEAAESQRDHVAAARARFADLTPRERELLQMLIAGKSSKQIASEMKLSFRTVCNHRAHLMAKTQAQNTADLVRLAMIAGISPEE